MASSTGGSDAADLHSYSLAVGLDDKGNANVGASYSYSGWLPSTRIAAARTLGDRVGQLEDELRRVERERDILKKALAILSRNA